jgi:hypothetical protein
MLAALVAFDVAQRRMKAQFETDVEARLGAERENRSRPRIVSALAVRVLGQASLYEASAPRISPGPRRLEPKRH